MHRPRHLGVLAAAAALLAASASAQVERKVLIVGIDGMRSDALQAANTPNIDALIADGAVSYACQAEDITISGPGWSSILTGVHRTKHLVVDNTFVPSNYATYPHFFKRLEEACDVRTASIAHWAPVNTQILAGNADIIQSGLVDDDVTAACVSLIATGDPDVVFVHLDDVDHAGHASGFSPTNPEYIAAIEAQDARIGLMRAAIDARPSAATEDWLIIMTSDHGGSGTSHGQNIPEHRNTTLVVSGASAARGLIADPCAITDTPATVFTFLGLPINPAWNWDSQPRGLNMGASPSQPLSCVPPPPPPVGACCTRSGSCSLLLASECNDLRAVFSGIGITCQAAECKIPAVLFAEGFDSVPLGPSVNETPAGTLVWTSTPPSGWSINNTGVPTGGVTEWRGWTFATRTWWSTVAADQGRSGFTKASGATAIADSDEWADLAHGGGTYSTFMSTPPISLANAQPGTGRLILDSSWIPEGGQSASIIVSFDGAAPVTILNWTSSGPDLHAAATNETLSIPLANPPGATSMVLRFGLFNANNNWWWAIDNIEVIATPVQSRVLLLSEDFELVPLGPSVDEAAADHVWSGAFPAGWIVDDSGVPGVGNPAVGVTEWEGWAVTSRSWWSTIAGDQGRAQFTRGIGAIAVAEADEWDDIGSPSALGPYNARVSTPAISLAGVLANSVQVSFDSSWRFEGNQRALLTAEFDGSAPLTLLDWRSQAGVNFKPDATNESVLIPVNNPAGARTMRLTFGLLDARNNWWWAYDNLAVTARPVACPCDSNGSGGVSVEDIFQYLNNYFSGQGDFNRDGATTVQDIFSFLDCYFQPSPGC